MSTRTPRAPVAEPAWAEASAWITATEWRTLAPDEAEHFRRLLDRHLAEHAERAPEPPSRGARTGGAE